MCSKCPELIDSIKTGMFNKYWERFALSSGRESERTLFEGNSKAPTVGVPGRQVCLQKGLCESPVGARVLQSSPPAQTRPTSLPQSASRRLLEPEFDSTANTINHVQTICLQEHCDHLAAALKGGSQKQTIENLGCSLFQLHPVSEINFMSPGPIIADNLTVLCSQVKDSCYDFSIHYKYHERTRT